jgi:hypothetical protein
MPIRLERADQLELLFRDHAGEDAHRAHTPRQLLVGHGLELGAGDASLGVVKPNLSSYGERGPRVIAGDHHNPNASPFAFLDRLGNAGSDGIVQPGEAQVFEVEVVLLPGQSFVLLEVCSGYTQHSLSSGSGLFDLRRERGKPL